MAFLVQNSGPISLRDSDMSLVLDRAVFFGRKVAIVALKQQESRKPMVTITSKTVRFGKCKCAITKSQIQNVPEKLYYRCDKNLSYLDFFAFRDQLTRDDSNRWVAVGNA